MRDYGALIRRIQDDPTAREAEQLAESLGPRWRMLRAVGLAQRGLRGSARRELTQAVKGAPSDAVVLASAGLVAYVCRDYDEALSLFDRAAREGGGWRALRLKYEHTVLLGREHEARRIIEEAIAQGTPDAARWHAEALSLFSRHCVYELAIRHGRAAVELRPDVPTLHMELANIYAELDDVSAARSSIAHALELKPELMVYRMEAAQMLIRLGCFREAHEQLQAVLGIVPHCAPAHEALGSLALWSGVDEEAEYRGRRALECDPSFAPAARLLGACAWVQGNLGEARRRFDQALWLDPGESQSHVFFAELAYRNGRLDETRDQLSRAMTTRGYLFVAQLLWLLVSMNEYTDPKFAPGRIAHLIKGVSELCPGLEERLRKGDAEPWKQAVATALDRMRGNRSTTPTYLAGEALTLLRTGVDPRFDSRRALQAIRVSTPAETLAALDEAARKHATSGLPLAHKGELLLWLGELSAARAALEQAIEIEPETRWAYIGLTTIDVLEDHPQRAIETSARGVTVMHGTEGPAIPVIRGEALWMLDRLAEAEHDLERACTLHPSRISAPITLGLLRVAQRDVEGARMLVSRLQDQAPGLVSDAAHEESLTLFADEPIDLSLTELGRLLERMRAMLRGNRSSTCITYFTAAAELRGVHRHADGCPTPHASDTSDLDRARLLLERAIGVAPVTAREATGRASPAAERAAAGHAPARTARGTLSAEQIARFTEQGYIVLRGCIPRALIDRWIADARQRMRSDPYRWVRQHNPADSATDASRIDLDDPSTWTLHTMDVFGSKNTPFEAVSPLLWGAICDLLGGADRIAVHTLADYFVLKLNAPTDNPTGWHIDDPPRPFRIDSLRNGLVGILLFSNVEPGGGPTVLAPESLGIIARRLACSDGAVAWDKDSASHVVAACSRYVECTGEAGDVYLTHPLVAHRSSRNVSARARWMANPMIYTKEPLRFRRDDPATLSPVELSVARAIGGV